jgi:hypothetical protein
LLVVNWVCLAFFKKKRNKKTLAVKARVFEILVASAALLVEAVSAVYRTIAARTERNLGFNTTSCTGYVMHFTLLEAGVATSATTVVLLFASCTAFRAAARFVSETFFCEEILFRC